MAKRAFAILVGAAAVAAAVGCGGVSESDLVGNWTSRTETEPAAGSGAAGQAAEVAKDVFAPRLELNKDRTFTLTVGLPMEGTWEFEDGQVILTATEVAGMDASGMRKSAKTIVLDVSDDGKKLTSTVSSGSLSVSVDFSKVDE
ncbi:MAG: hypothetical protein IIC73_07210, partial [Armatimonadetes bacterium]|nr:hypothetical protein [Armatimonadota bacterium]